MTATSTFSSGAAIEDVLARHGTRVALIDEAGQTLTYDELLAAAKTFVHDIGAARQLVFLEAHNTFASISAYVGCLIGQHAVHLFQDAADPLVQRLVEVYRPHLVVSSAGGALRVDRQHDEALDLHPDLRVLLSTSGSTGSPKFVKLSERNIVSNAQAIAEYLEIGLNDRAITSLKFNYSYGMSVVNSHLLAGGSLLLTERSVSETVFWGLFEEHGATSFAGVPYTFETLVRTDAALERLTNLRHVTQAGGRLSPEFIRRFGQLGREQGWRFYVMYGQTEAAPRIAYLPPEMCEEFPGAIGRPIPGGTIELLDESGKVITEAGVPGELAYSGPNVMLGYAENRDELVADDTPARLLTGDIAQWNAAGLVEIVGRTKRFVKCFGLRINLDEVEAAAREHEAEAAATGMDEMIVIALPEDAGISDHDLIAALAAGYHLPAFVFRVIRFDGMPRLANGKIAYRAILDRVGGDAPAHPAPRVKRKSLEWALARNQMITLLISGLWHGPAWTFVSWGGFHGALLILQRQLSRLFGVTTVKSAALRGVTIACQIAAVFTLVAISRILFRAENWPDALTVFRKIMSGPYNWAALDGKGRLAFSVALIALTMSAEALVEFGFWRRHIASKRVLRIGTAMLAFLLVLALGEFSGGRFIYVQF
jgi:acyl-CoA synthetase (AMP-forming)/AMP-acid ligase II